MEKFLKVVSIGDEKTATDGRKYRTVKLQPQTSLPNGQMIMGSKVSGRNFWAQDPSGNPDPLYNNIRVGTLIEGRYVSAKVEPYEIDGRTVDTYGAIVLGHENWERVFENAGHILVDETVTQEESIEVD